MILVMANACPCVSDRIGSKWMFLFRASMRQDYHFLWKARHGLEPNS